MSGLTLPEEAVDRHEVRWFTHSVSYGVTEHRAVYHVSTPWGEAEQTADCGQDGVDFVDHWQIFINGRFTGRSNSGWEAILACVPDEPITDPGEAGVEHRVALRRRIRLLEDELATMRRRLRVTSDEDIRLSGTTPGAL